MAFLPEKLIDKWYKRDSFVYKNYVYRHKNPLVDKDIQEGASLCPYFRQAIFIGFLWYKCFAVPVCGLLNKIFSTIANILDYVASKCPGFVKLLNTRIDLILYKTVDKLKPYKSFIAFFVLSSTLISLIKFIYTVLYNTFDTYKVLSITNLYFSYVLVIVSSYAYFGLYTLLMKKEHLRIITKIAIGLVILPLIGLLYVTVDWNSAYSLLLETLVFLGTVLTYIILPIVLIVGFIESIRLFFKTKEDNQYSIPVDMNKLDEFVFQLMLTDMQDDLKKDYIEYYSRKLRKTFGKLTSEDELQAFLDNYIAYAVELAYRQVYNKHFKLDPRLSRLSMGNLNKHKADPHAGPSVILGNMWDQANITGCSYFDSCMYKCIYPLRTSFYYHENPKYKFKNLIKDVDYQSIANELRNKLEIFLWNYRKKQNSVWNKITGFIVNGIEWIINSIFKVGIFFLTGIFYLGKVLESKKEGLCPYKEFYD